MIRKMLRLWAVSMALAMLAWMPVSMRAEETPSTAAKAPEKPAAAKAPEAPKKVKKATTPDISGEVVAVDAIAKTITLKSKSKEQVFHITSETRFFKTGKPAILQDVQTGQSVSIKARLKDKINEAQVVTVKTESKIESKDKKT